MRAASYSRAERATNVDVITAVMIAMKAVPSSITSAPTSLPLTCVGVTSPYPTVVTVCKAHHIPIPMFGYSSWSSS